MHNYGFCPVQIQFAALDAIEKEMTELSGQGKVLIIAERTCTDGWQITSNIKKWLNHGHHIWIDQISQNPTQQDIKNVLEIINGQNLTSIIVIGGGSCIDLAKAVSAFHPVFSGQKSISVKAITDNILSKQYIRDNRQFNIIAIPTTAGTGSELTKWATIWDVDKNNKFSIDDDSLYPQKALIIPELTLTLPRPLILATGLDALCHATESYWAETSNLLVKDIALQAIRRITSNLTKALDNPLDNEVRSQLCRGSLLASLAFSQTRTTACHAISYPLTLKYNIPHGLAAAITLHAVADINRQYFAYAEELFDAFAAYGGIKGFIDTVSKGIVNLRLSSFGIQEQDLSEIAEKSFTTERMGNNPVNISKEQVFRILCEVF